MSAETIVNMAEFGWKVISGRSASAAISKSTANAVPQVPDWQSLTNSVGPRSVRMHHEVPFLWPLDGYLHSDITIRLKWSYGARYKGGGAYIPNIWVEVPTCFVGWPWDADIDMICRNPENASGPGEPPVARMPVTIRGSVGSGAEYYSVDWGMTIYGTGDVDV